MKTIPSKLTAIGVVLGLVSIWLTVASFLKIDGDPIQIERALTEFKQLQLEVHRVHAAYELWIAEQGEIDVSSSTLPLDLAGVDSLIRRLHDFDVTKLRKPRYAIAKPQHLASLGHVHISTDSMIRARTESSQLPSPK